MAAGKIVPWPWTINVQGTGYYYETIEEAIAAVREFQARGVRSIDVGCMQVNLYHHPHAFQTLEQAFDPEENVAYAASFLLKLKTHHASWHQAVAHYHSANPVHHQPYQKAVFLVWDGQDDGEMQKAHWKEGYTYGRSFHKQRLPLVYKAALKVPSGPLPIIRRVSRGGLRSI
jgi:hypothetical protein